LIENERKALKEWKEKRGEPNLVEIERKTLDFKSKWENVFKLQKRKKVILRHLSKAKK